MSKNETATPGRIVHYHLADAKDDAPALPALVIGDAPEGGVDLFLFPTRHQGGEVVQAVRHDDEDPEENDPENEAQPRTHQAGTWGWPPRA